ncbi:hypothetical protein C8J57DRAFT_1530761 [Mycena rebaudengoi]|nr:hypothetical protein C8J57DRAFT_1530761 [Mycena rebaudengoi]
MPRTSESRNANALAIAFSVAATAIAVAATAAEFTPFPYIHQLSSLASSILNSIQAVKDNKAAFKRLATDAYELVHAVKNMADEGRTISFLLKRNLEDLVATLTAINDFALRHTSRGFFVVLLVVQPTPQKSRSSRGESSIAHCLRAELKSIRTHENIVEMREELRLWSLERRDPPAAPDASPIAPPALPHATRTFPDTSTTESGSIADASTLTSSINDGWAVNWYSAFRNATSRYPHARFK